MDDPIGIESFAAVDGAVLSHLRQRIAHTRRPELGRDRTCDAGVDRAYARSLLATSADGFDWQQAGGQPFVSASARVPRLRALRGPALLVEDIRTFFTPLREAA